MYRDTRRNKRGPTHQLSDGNNATPAAREKPAAAAAAAAEDE